MSNSRPRIKKFKLKIELVPSTVWFSSIFQIYKKKGQLKEWKKIKRKIFEKEGKHCWICRAKNHRLDAHEFWKYDDRNHIQKLIAIHHLCFLCHQIKHIGFWCYTSEGIKILEKSGLSRKDLINHFCKVNNCSKKEFKSHEQEALRIWRERSKYKWKQDFGEYNIKKEKHERKN